MTPRRTRIRLALAIAFMMISSRAYTQYLSSTRSFARAASLSFSEDVNSLDWNPAGLVRVSLWELTGTSFYGLHASQGSPSFQSLGIGTQIADNQSVVFRVS